VSASPSSTGSQIASGRCARSDVARGAPAIFYRYDGSQRRETIRFAKLGGFESIATYDGTWSASLGSYPINMKNFPGGAHGRGDDEARAKGLCPTGMGPRLAGRLPCCRGSRSTGTGPAPHDFGTGR
jgi:hypothetical protein